MNKNNRTQSSKSASVNRSQFFNVTAVNIEVKCCIKPDCFANLSSFLVALQRVHPLSVNTSTSREVLAKLILSLISILSMHDSSLLARFHRQSTFLYMPSFFMPIFQRICLKSVSSNKVSGYTTGVLVNELNFKQYVDILLKANVETYVKALHNTNFMQLVMTDESLRQLKLLIIELLSGHGYKLEFVPHESSATFIKSAATSETSDSDIDSLDIDFSKCTIRHTSSDSDLPDILARNLSSISTVFKYNQNVNYYSGTLTFEVVQDLSIFRFRNTDNPYSFRAQQGTLIGPDSRILDLYANFLRITTPCYDSDRCVIAGDLTLTVESVPISEAWYSYLGFSTTGDEPTSPEGKSSRSKPRRSKPKTENPGITQDISSTQSTKNGTTGGSTMKYHTSILRPISFIGTGISGSRTISIYQSHYSNVCSYSIREYHSSRISSLPEWLPALGKLFKMAPSVCPTPSVMYPQIDISSPVPTVKLGVKAAVGILTDSLFYKTVGAVSIAGISTILIFMSFQKVYCVYDVINSYNQIISDPNFAVYLETSIPVLSDFNQNAASLLAAKTLNVVSYDQCSLIVKFCIYNKQHMFYSILIDISNALQI